MKKEIYELVVEMYQSGKGYGEMVEILVDCDIDRTEAEDLINSIVDELAVQEN